MNEIIIESLTRSIVWCLCCGIIRYLSSKVSKFSVPKFNTLSLANQRDWYSRSASTVHAIVMISMMLYYWIWINPKQEITEFVTYHQALALDIMNGYLIYDSIVDLFYSNSSFDMLGHHVLGYLSHSSSRYSNNGAAGYYSMLVYIAEASTPFLHVSWLMYQLNLKENLLFTIVSSLLVILFFICRFLLGPYMLYHMIRYKAEWGPHGQGLLFWFNFTIVFVFTVLNIFWFYKLVAIKLSVKPKSKSS